QSLQYWQALFLSPPPCSRACGPFPPICPATPPPPPECLCRSWAAHLAINCQVGLARIPPPVRRILPIPAHPAPAPQSLTMSSPSRFPGSRRLPLLALLLVASAAGARQEPPGLAVRVEALIAPVAERAFVGVYVASL